ERRELDRDREQEGLVVAGDDRPGRMVAQDLVDLVGVVHDGRKDEHGPEHESERREEPAEDVTVDEGREPHQTRKPSGAGRLDRARLPFRPAEERQPPAAALAAGAAARHEADGEEDQVRQPHREWGAHPALLGPRLAVGNEHVVEDEDRERQRETAALAAAPRALGEWYSDDRER